MEMIERYIYAVIQKLPNAQKEDIALELRGLINDMLEERFQDNEVTKKEVETVLTELGNPKQLAQQYRGTKTYLIGPDFFDAFMTVWKIVLVAVSVSLIGVFVIDFIMDPPSILRHFISLLVSLFTVVPMALGWTVFGFVMAEHFTNIDSKDLQMSKQWKVSELPPLPDKKTQIKRGETIFGIIFYILFLTFFSFSHDYFGVWVFRDGFSHVVPFLSKEAAEPYVFLIILFIFGFGIVKESLKLVFGKWTKKLVFLTAVVNLVSVAAFLLLMNSSTFLNPDFMLELTQAGVMTKGSEAYDVVKGIWDASPMWILIVLVFTLIIEGLTGIYKLRK